MKRGPYRMRATTVTCGRCGTKHKWNQCPKRIPRALRQRMQASAQPTRGQLHDAHFRDSIVEKAIREEVQRKVREDKAKRTAARREQREQAKLRELLEHRKFLQRLEQEEGPEQWAAELSAIEQDAQCED